MRGLGGSDVPDGFWKHISVKDDQSLDRAGHTATVAGRFIYIVGGRNR